MEAGPTGAAPAPSTPSTAPSGTNGAHGPQTPAKAPPTTPAVVKPAAKSETGNTAKDHALGRGRDGKFLAKEGEPGEAPKEPEPYRFKRKLKADGAEFEVDLDEEGLAREVQIARAARQRLATLAAKNKELDERESRAKEAPHEFLEKLGIDPDKWAAERLSRKAQDGLMSEEERAFRETQAENARLKQQVEQHARAEQERHTRAVADQLWQKEEPRYLEAIKKHNLPTGNEVMGHIAQVGLEYMDAGVPLEPEQVVALAAERLGKYADRYVFGLDTPSLVAKLGPEKVADIVRHHIAEFRKSQESRFAEAKPNEPPPAYAEPQRREIIGSAELERRSRDFIASLRRK